MQPPSRTFDIDRCLGRGGFGEVYRARMAHGNGVPSDVALKVLRRDIDPAGQAVQRLRDEGRLLARLNHPAILRVHDLTVLDGRIALVTEFVDGDDLSVCMTGPAPIGPRALCEVIAIIGGALQAAWDAPGEDGPLRLVHRDIKPSNLRISRHGEVKLLDFGIARTDSTTVERESRTRTGMMVGSPAYMPPERFLERTIHLGSDVFSLCAILFEGLTGERFYGDLPVPMQVGLAVDDARYADHLEQRLATVEHAALVALLRAGLAHRPDERPSPGSLARTLEELADGLRGPSLSRFVRERTWSDPDASMLGELDGRTLTESGLRRVASAPPRPGDAPTLERPRPIATPSPRRLWPWGLATVVLLGLGIAGVVGLSGSVALVSYGLSAPDEGEPMLVPTLPAPTPLPEPQETEEPVPAPAPSSAPVERPVPSPPVARATPVPEPKSAPEPEVSPASPAPSPAPAPSAPVPAPATGNARVSGDVRVALRGAGGKVHAAPGDVPVGAYTLVAFFNGMDGIEAGQVTVTEGASVSIDCSAKFTRCTVK